MTRANMAGSVAVTISDSSNNGVAPETRRDSNFTRRPSGLNCHDREYLFSPSPVNLEDPVVLRNLSEPDAGKILYDEFKSAMNALNVIVKN